MQINKIFLFLALFLGFSIISLAGKIDGTVFKLVDGDTLHITEIGTSKLYKIRFLGIDAPETNYQGQSQGDYGEKAKAYVKKMTPLGTKVTVYYEKEKFDSFGRLLGHVYKGNQNICLLLLKKGLAVNYAIYPNLAKTEEYAKATQYAIDNELGIFSVSNYELPFEFRLRIGNRDPDKYVGDFKTKELVKPDYFDKITISNRVFFYKKIDAEKSGYSLKP